MNRIQYPSEAEYVFLDLDGTLTDPSLGIINATIQALEYFGIHEDDNGSSTQSAQRSHG